MNWIEVVNVIQDVGVSIAILGVVIFLLTKYFSNLIDSKTKGKDNETEKNANGLQYNSVKTLKIIHPIFNKIDNIVNVKVPIVRIGGPVRTKIFRDVLTIYYKTAKQEILGILDKDINLRNFLSCNYTLVNDVAKNSNEKMRMNGIPEVVIEKWNTWVNSKYDYMLRTISDIESSDVFSNVVEKQF